MSRKPSRGVQEPAAPEYQAESGVTASTVVSAKGQVVIPKAVREALGWDAGTRLVVQAEGDSVTLKPRKAGISPTRAENVFGMLKDRAITPPPPEEAVNRSIGEWVAEDHRRISRDRN